MNLMQIPASLPADEYCETIVTGGDVLIERIISSGHASPPNFWYDQEADEWVTVLQGSARLRLANGQTRMMTSGDWVLIPAHERHRVEWTSQKPPCIWLAVHGRLK